jgi:hypothetical protein
MRMNQKTLEAFRRDKLVEVTRKAAGISKSSARKAVQMIEEREYPIPAAEMALVYEALACTPDDLRHSTLHTWYSDLGLHFVEKSWLSWALCGDVLDLEPENELAIGLLFVAHMTRTDLTSAEYQSNP